METRTRIYKKWGYFMKMRKTKGIKKVISLLVISLLITCFPTVSSVASTSEAEQQFRELYLSLLETGDNSVQDISDLNLPYMTCYHIIQDVKRNEGFVPYHCYNDDYLIQADAMETKDDTPYLYKFHLELDNSGFEECYAIVKQMIAEVQSNLDDKMTDLDKLVWFHEYVVEKLEYNNTGGSEVHMGGPSLVQGYGVCEGYATAMAMFLKAENIPCELVIGGEHEWLKVKIDDEWYHVDPTWDDTVAHRYGTHYFLVRNDDEFVNTMDRKHDAWNVCRTFAEEKPDVSTDSTEYTDWYVHDVWNRMYYYDGYWYYISDNAVTKNNIQGTDESIIYEGTNLKITGMEEGVLTITNNGAEEEIELSKTEVTAIPTTTVQSTTSANSAVGTTTPTKGASTNNANTKKTKVGKPVIKTVTNKKGKKIKIVLKKKISGAKGYEVAYSTNKKFKKSVKKVRFTGTSKTISKLSKNKTYYVKVRAYKLDSNGERVYGSYSSVKKVKIKK